MPNVLNEFAGDGVTTSFNFSMSGGYLSRDYVYFFTRPNEDLLTYTPYDDADVTWIGDYTVQLNAPIPVGTTFVILRSTPLEPLVDFQNTSRITEKNLDTATQQSVHIAAETSDTVGRIQVVAQDASEGSAEALIQASVAADNAAQASALAAAAQAAASSAQSAASNAQISAAAAETAADAAAILAADSEAAAILATDTADGAVVTAGAAQAQAAAADTKATTALANANAATTTANAASAAAAAANNKADAAVVTANDAAADAVAAATQASADAAAAALSASGAQSTASTALGTANTANATANSASAAAASATSTADTANATANAASTAAAGAVTTANAASSTAGAAATDAATALSTANSATTTANAAATLAQEAKDLVDEAVEGGVVSFNGRAGVVVPQTGDYTKAQVGLPNVDNTSDAAKPVSTAQAAALALKADKTYTDTQLATKANTSTVNTALAAKAPLASPAFTGTVTGITKAMVGLPNVDNTSDANKPVSSAQATAISARVAKSGDTMTGNLNVPSLNGGMIGGLRNVLINGQMHVAQRTTDTIWNPDSGVYTLDRWRFDYNGTGASRSIQRLAVPAGQEEQTGGCTYYMQIVQGTPLGTGNTYQFVSQRVEGVRTLGGRRVVLSCYARLSVGTSGSLSAQLRQQFNGSAAVDTYLPGKPLSAAWQRFEWVVDLPSVLGKTIGDSNSYLEASLVLPTGAIRTVDITGVQLEGGDQATPFEARPYSLDLFLCQRYHQVVARVGMIAAGVDGGATGVYAQFPQMRALPTVDSFIPSSGSGHIVTADSPSSLAAVAFPDGAGFWSALLISLTAEL